MEIRKYIKNKIIYFSFFLALGIIFFMSQKADAAHQNAAIVCLIDDASNSFKTQVFYTGQAIEMGRISQFLPKNLQIIDGESDRLNLYDLTVRSSGGEEVSEDSEYYTLVRISNDAAGETTVSLVGEGGTAYPIVALNGVSSSSQYNGINTNLEENGFYSFDNVESSDDEFLPTPLTFPADTSLDANSAEINRAYEIAEVLGGDFNNALSFINGGKSFTSTKELISTAYGLCVIENGHNFINSQNMEYSVNYSGTSEDNGYTYRCSIVDKNASQVNYYEQLYDPNYSNNVDLADTLSTKNGSYVWKIKKGYKNSSYEEEMEDGTKNQIANRYGDETLDTTYITWQHLFLQASIYYAEGITYANQADIYNIEGMESSVTQFFQKILDGVSGFVNIYSMEELIFNKGVRGSKAFFMGTFNKSFEDYLLNMFLIFAAISVSLVFFIVVKMIFQRQLATANAIERASFAESVKDLLISLFFMSFSWGAIKVLLILNYQFVDIFSTLIGNKTLQRIAAGGILIGNVVVKFTYFVLEIYINYVYIIRGLVIAALIIVAPIFIISFNFGQKGKQMFWAWMRELTGSIFLQSLHALVYGIIIVASAGSRGIEGIVMIAAIIPLTSMFKEITGSGGDTIINTAKGLTQTTGTVMGSAAQLAGSAVGSLASGAGELTGNVIGAATGTGPIAASIGKGIGDSIGGAAEMAGGLMASSIGTGMDVSQVGGGTKLLSGGIKEAGQGFSKSVKGATSTATGAVSAIGSMGGNGVGGTSGSNVQETVNSGLVSSEKAPVSRTDPGTHQQRQAALDSLHSNPFLKNMQDARIAPEGDGSWTTLRAGLRAVEQEYAVPQGMALKDMTKSQEAAFRAIQNYRSDRANGTLAHFNRQYGSDYARVTTKMIDGKMQDVVTFGKFLTPPPSNPAPSAPVQNVYTTQQRPVMQQTVSTTPASPAPPPPQNMVTNRADFTPAHNPANTPNNNV